MNQTAKIKVFGIAGIALLLVAGWFLVLSPRMSKAGEIRDETATVEASNQALKTKITKLKKQAETLPQERQYEAEIEKKFPPTAQQPQLFQAIRNAAIQAGIPERGVTGFAPGVPQAAGAAGSVAVPGQKVAAGSLATQTITLSAHGGFSQIVQFMRNLENLDRAFVVGSVSVVPGTTKGGSDYVLNLTGTMYVLSAPVDPQVAGAKVTAPVDAAAPAASGAPAPTVGQAGGARQ